MLAELCCPCSSVLVRFLSVLGRMAVCHPCQRIPSTTNMVTLSHRTCKVAFLLYPGSFSLLEHGGKGR